MPEAVINDAVRTPIGALGGALSEVRTGNLATMWVGIDQLEAMIVERIDNVP